MSCSELIANSTSFTKTKQTLLSPPPLLQILRQLIQRKYKKNIDLILQNKCERNIIYRWSTLSVQMNCNFTFCLPYPQLLWTTGWLEPIPFMMHIQCNAVSNPTMLNSPDSKCIALYWLDTLNSTVWYHAIQWHVVRSCKLLDMEVMSDVHPHANELGVFLA